MSKNARVLLFVGLVAAPLVACSATSDGGGSTDDAITGGDGALCGNPRYAGLTDATALKHFCEVREAYGYPDKWDGTKCTAGGPSGRSQEAKTAKVTCRDGEIVGFEEFLTFAPTDVSLDGVSYPCGDKSEEVPAADVDAIARFMAKFPFSTFRLDVRGLASNTAVTGTTNQALAEGRAKNALERLTRKGAAAAEKLDRALPYAALEAGSSSGEVKNCPGHSGVVQDCKANEAACRQVQRAVYQLSRAKK
jgi:hypothetical protein